MSVLFPITTREDAIAAYHANAMYDMRGGNLEQCESFINACRFLLQTPLTASEQPGAGSMEMDPRITKEMLDKAEAWYAVHYTSATTSAQRYADFTFYRD